MYKRWPSSFSWSPDFQTIYIYTMYYILLLNLCLLMRIYTYIHMYICICTVYTLYIHHKSKQRRNWEGKWSPVWNHYPRFMRCVSLSWGKALPDIYNQIVAALICVVAKLYSLKRLRWWWITWDFHSEFFSLFTQSSRPGCYRLRSRNGALSVKIIILDAWHISQCQSCFTTVIHWASVNDVKKVWHVSKIFVYRFLTIGFLDNIPSNPVL